MQAPWTTLRYRDGHMLHSPDQGRIEITLCYDGRACISDLPRPRDKPRVTEVQVAPWVLDAITSCLHEAGFPDLPPRTLPVGVRVVLLSVATADGVVQVWISPAHRRELPPLDQAMRLLEAVAHAATRGEPRHGPIERALLA
jgi:hypothetical protein